MFETVTLGGLILAIVLIVALLYLSVRIVTEYDRLVVFRLGRTGPDKIKGPGLVFLIPIVDRPVRVDLREQFIEVPSQTTITKDNAPISIDFLIYWRISDPLRSIVNVAYFAGALQGIATTTLRAVIGDILLDDVLSKRDQINEVLRTKLDEQTERWGGKVTTVEIREIIPPRDVQDAMNRMLSAERNRRAVITESEGARQSTINVAEGEKQSSILRAEGKRQSAILEAEGFSQALERIYWRRPVHRRADDAAAVPRDAQGASAPARRPSTCCRWSSPGWLPRWASWWTARSTTTRPVRMAGRCRQARLIARCAVHGHDGWPPLDPARAARDGVLCRRRSRPPTAPPSGIHDAPTEPTARPGQGLAAVPGRARTRAEAV